MTKKTLTGCYAGAYESKTPADNRVLYDKWAASYDGDMVEYDCVATVKIADYFVRYVQDLSAVVLDAGCGTGLSGLALAEEGFSVIDGVDISPQMLEKAREKKVYRRLDEGNIVAGLDIADNAYDALICVGAFTVGHLPPDCIGELARVVKKSGIVIITVNELVYEEEKFPAVLHALEERGVISCLENVKDEYVIATKTQAYYIVLRVREG